MWTSVIVKGYVREYWAPEKDEANAFCYIVDKLGNRVSEELYAELNDGELEPFSTMK